MDDAVGVSHSHSLVKWKEQFIAAQNAFRTTTIEPYKDVFRVYENLRAKAISLAAENKQLRSQTESLKAELSSSSGTYAGPAPTQITKLQTKLLESQDQVNDLLRQKHEDVRSRLELSEANQKLKEENQQLAADTARIARSLRSLTEEADKLKEALKKREEEALTSGEEILRLRSLLANKCSECDHLTAENDNLRGRMMSEKMKDIEQINSMNNVLENVKRERERAMETAAAQQARILELTRAVAQLSTLPQAPAEGAAQFRADAPSDARVSQVPSPALAAPKSSDAGGGTTQPAKILSWFTTMVNAAADKVSGTIQQSSPDGSVKPALGARAVAAAQAETAVPAFMSQSVAGIMSEYIITSLPIPSRVSSIVNTVHSAEVNCVKFSENSRLLASGSSDGNVSLIDPMTGMRQATLYTSTEGNAVICVDVYGTTVIGGCTDRTVRIWDLTTQRLTRSLTGHFGKVHSLVYVPPSSATSMGASQALSRGLLFSAGADRVVKLWDLRDGRCIRSIDAKSIVNGISLSSDGSIVACANQDSGVRLFDVRTGSKIVENTTAHTMAATSVAFSRNDGSARLLSASRDNTLRLLDGRTLEPLRAFLPPSFSVGQTSVSVGSVLDKMKAAEGTGGLDGSLSGSALIMK
jgi:hypothetical protein